MSAVIYQKLLAIFLTVGLGFTAARLRWLGEMTPAAARLLGNLAFNVFVAALLFRTAARLNFATMPWGTVLAYYLPTFGVIAAIYAWQRARLGSRADEPAHPVNPSARAVSGSFGNAVQLGIPLATALWGEAGLAVHIPLVSLHALIILAPLTFVAEWDLARAHAKRHGAQPMWPMMKSTLRNILIHPVMLPILAGIAWNLTGIALPRVLDEVLQLLSSAVVPVCLVLIGVNLQAYGLKGRLSAALPTCIFKLLVLPLTVLVVARWGFGLTGVPLQVCVLMAALPVGSNGLLFAQRYETLEAEATLSIVLSALLFVLTSSLWLAVLSFVH